MLYLLICLLPLVVNGEGFVFELGDRESQCFYEEFFGGAGFVFDFIVSIVFNIFQVLTGGNFDVDVDILDPKGEYIKRFERTDEGEFNLKHTQSGFYKVRNL